MPCTYRIIMPDMFLPICMTTAANGLGWVRTCYHDYAGLKRRFRFGSLAPRAAGLGAGLAYPWLLHW